MSGHGRAHVPTSPAQLRAGDVIRHQGADRVLLAAPVLADGRWTLTYAATPTAVALDVPEHGHVTQVRTAPVATSGRPAAACPPPPF